MKRTTDMVGWFALAIAGLAPAPYAVEVASGEGHRGPWQQNDSDFRYVDDPAIDLASDGDALVAWVDQSKMDVFLQRYARDGSARWKQAVNVAPSGSTFSWLPRVSVDSKEPKDVAILWQEIVFVPGGGHGGEIMFARSNDGGRTFGAPINLTGYSKEGEGKGRLTETEWHNGSYALARDDSGGIYVAWTEYEGGLWFRKSTDRGTSFAPRVRVGGDSAAPARLPSLAVAGSNVYLAWAKGESAKADIHVASSTDGGKTFGSKGVVAATSGHSDAPAIAVDNKGTLHLAYAESPAGPNKKYEIRYTKRAKGGAEFEPSRKVEGADNAHFPELAVDSKGHLFVSWDRYEGKEAHARALLVSKSDDGGATFAEPRKLFSAPAGSFSGSQQGVAAKLAVSSSGEIAAANSTFTPEKKSQIWLIR